MAEPYVFDAFALLALFAREPGSDLVRAILEQPGHQVYMSAVNLGEVYYTLLRRRGRPEAETAEATIFQQPRLQVVEPTWENVRAAAEIKAEGGLSYADSFAVSLARTLNAPLVTADPELAPFERRGVIRVIWLSR